MRGDGGIDPKLICGPVCGQFQQVDEPTCRGDHVGERACIDQAAELGCDEKQTMRLEKSCTRMLDNTIWNKSAKCTHARARGLTADSRRRSAESSRLAGAKVRRLALTADLNSTDLGGYFDCARTTKALRRISTR
jgi:hypothetical protein